MRIIAFKGTRWSTIGILAVSVILIAAAANGIWQLAQVLRVEAKGPVDGDALIYLTVASGILNGLKPYIDLFESKPPGMYLVMLVSLILSGGMKAATMMQVLILAALPFLLGWYAWRESRLRAERRGRVMLSVGIAFVLGLQFGLLLEGWSGALQTESFGAFFGILYVLTIATDKQIGAARMWIAAIWLLCSVGMKEPFVLSNLGAALLLSRSSKDFLRKFVIPLALAMLLGTVILALTGWLKPYLHLYLPAMLEYRIESRAEDPVWLRGLRVNKIFSQMTTFSEVPTLGVVLAMGWVAGIAVKVGARRKWASVVAVAVAVATVAAMHFSYILLKVIVLAKQVGIADMGNDPFFRTMIARYALGACIYVGGAIAVWRYEKRCIVHVLLAATALYLLTLSNAVGGFFVNHASFAFPGYVAMAVWALYLFRKEGGNRTAAIACTVLVVAGAAVMRPSPERLKYLSDSMRFRQSSEGELVDAVDRLLDACGEQRFLFIGKFPELAYSKHSPIGPMFLQFFHWYLPREHPLYELTRANADRDAHVVVNLVPEEVNYPLAGFVAKEFTEEAPRCAREISMPSGIEVLYRKGWSGPSDNDAAEV